MEFAQLCRMSTADPVNTPFLTAIGGLTGGMQTDDFEFPTDSQYSLPAAKQDPPSQRRLP